MTRLHQIQEAVRLRAQEITSIRPDWPCRKGCDDCCRRLASVPQVTRDEWEMIASAIDGMPADVAEMVRQRIRDAACASRPVVCPLLDRSSGTCLVYEARPVACRSYGFYAENQYVLGCERIEAIGRESGDVVWGNHVGLDERLRALGGSATLSEWFAQRY